MSHVSHLERSSYSQPFHHVFHVFHVQVSPASQVNYSGLNYKDGMAICGIYGVVETLPLITGIDFVGVVDVAWFLKMDVE